MAPGPQATVRLADGSVLTGTVTARDYEHDLAALWVAAHDLPAVAVGDSDALLVGQLVFAIGNPRHIAGALRIGIVHAFGRASPPPGGVGLRPTSICRPAIPAVRSAMRPDKSSASTAMAARDGRGFAVPSKIVEAFLGRPADRKLAGFNRMHMSARAIRQPGYRRRRGFFSLGLGLTARWPMGLQFNFDNIYNLSF